jgi:hypothetical protein
MQKESAKARMKDVKPAVNVKQSASKRATLKTAEAAVEDTPKVIEQPSDQQSAGIVVVQPLSETNVLQDSTEQIAVAAVLETAEITELPPEPQTVNTPRFSGNAWDSTGTLPKPLNYHQH